MILVVDDDVGIRETIALLLEQQGEEVVSVANASLAIEVLMHKAASIEVVILDMGMPPHEHSAEEGLRVLDAVQAHSFNCKVLVLTGQEAEKTSYQAIKHGAFDFLSKPISAVDLLSAVKRAKLFLHQTQKLKQEEGIHKFEIDLSLGDGVKNARNQAEYRLVKQVLIDTQFNVHEVARRLGLKRENIYYLIKKYGIKRDEAEC